MILIRMTRAIEPGQNHDFMRSICEFSTIIIRVRETYSIDSKTDCDIPIFLAHNLQI